MDGVILHIRSPSGPNGKRGCHLGSAMVSLGRWAWAHALGHCHIGVSRLVACVCTPLRIPATCVRCIARSLWASIGWERRRASAYDALLRVLALQCLQGHLLAVVAAIGVAADVHCNRIWHCRCLTAAVVCCTQVEGDVTRAVALCALVATAPLFPPKHKPLNTLGGVQAIGQRYRNWMNVYPNREWGPTRATEREAKGDVALMRAAASREAVGIVAGRLRAEADAQHLGLREHDVPDASSASSSAPDGTSLKDKRVRIRILEREIRKVEAGRSSLVTCKRCNAWVHLAGISRHMKTALCKGSAASPHSEALPNLGP